MLYNCTVDIRDGNFVLVKHRKIGDCLHLYILPIMQKLGGLEYLQTIVPTENSDRVFYGQKSRNSMRNSTQVGQKTAYYHYTSQRIFFRADSCTWSKSGFENNYFSYSTTRYPFFSFSLSVQIFHFLCFRILHFLQLHVQNQSE